MQEILLRRFSRKIVLNSRERNQWRLVHCILYNLCHIYSKKPLRNTSSQFQANIYFPKDIASRSCTNIGKWSMNNYLNGYFLQSNYFNTTVYPLLEKEKTHKFYDEVLGECEIRHKKDKMGEYKIVVCEKEGKPPKNAKYDLPTDSVNIFKLLGAIALTLVGIVLAAYGTVLFVTIAANVIVFASIVSFIVISFRLIKSRIFGKGKKF